MDRVPPNENRYLPPAEESFVKGERKYRELISGLDRATDNLKVSCVVIASGELENDHFWRMLRSVATQRGVESDQFEVLYVVNQWRQPFGGGDLGRSQENRDTLEILRNLRMCEEGRLDVGEAIDLMNRRLSEELTEYEERIFKLAVDRAVRFVAVDATDECWQADLYLAGQMRTRARDIGGHAAYSRLPKSGYVDFVDADCEFPRNYFASMVRRTESGDKKVLLKRLEPVLTGDVEFDDGVEDIDRAATLLLCYLTSVFAHRDRYTDVGVHASAIGGAQIAVSPEVFAETGGYGMCFDTRNEDYAFSRMALDVVDAEAVEVIGDTYVYVGERLRSDSVDGELAHDYVQAESGDMFRVFSKIRQTVDQRVDQTASRWLQQNKNMEQAYGTDSRYQQIRAREYNREALARRHNQDMLRKAVAVVCDGKSLNRVLGTGESGRATDFLGSHGNLEFFLRFVVNQFRVEYGDGDLKSRVWEYLVEIMPEYFGDIGTREPDYAEISSVGMRDTGVTIRDLVHLSRTLFYWKRERELE